MPYQYYNLAMNAISIKLPDALHHALVQKAKSTARRQSDIVRLALDAYLKNDAQNQPGSCAAQAARWAGMVDGPADLSTNPGHMAGFGQ